MRSARWPSLLLFCSLTSHSFILAASAEEAALPLRRPGLWLISTISPEIGLQKNQVCIAATDSILGEAGEGCAIPVVTRQSDALIVTIACGRDGDRDTTSLLFTGDFQSWYRAQSRTTSGTRRSGFTIDARFLAENCDPTTQRQRSESGRAD